MTTKEYETVKVEKEDRVGWMILNRPEKRNAMNPQMHYDMEEVINHLSLDPEIDVIVLTGAGESFCAGMDLKEYFRALDNDPAEQIIVAPDCGLKYLPRDVAFGKIKAMAMGAAMVRQELS